ncbi:SDR family oxidoreductase [Salmonella enterica]|uniref:SDR family oxidoreductase n=1 Tax=Salmonella enterica TaxID=28901 RepID=A0A402QBP9_SALER|nr:SDR family oxidoreductase [Salmonella enterica]EKN5802384.1 SDR family oxidoreductase [Salmonella enterica subsp. enterica]HAU3261084.1 SDR family oxidoreductase [Salmonella enterica subsp. diarizonae]EBB9770095.1 SDR family oxidoreductase [Salmonella enterica]EDT0431751.1 SDR family oxidoreductase [Salmonella enterica]
MEKVLVVGGLTGIGKSVVELLKNDYIVETLSRSQVNELTNIKHHSIDATNSCLLNEYFKNSNGYDHLVITAADTPIGGINSLTDEQVKYAIHNKLLLSYICARDIIYNKTLTFISGYLSVRPGNNSTLQSAINAAIEGLTRSIAVEKAPLRVNCISPGTINGGLWNQKPPEIREKVMKDVSQKNLVGYPGKPLDIAKAVKFVIESPFITAEIIYIDGGARFGKF